MGNPRRANGWRRDRQRARIRAQGQACCICGMPIDYTLKAPDPWSFVVDETIPLKHGGTMTYDNQRAAHWWCNRIKSTHSLKWAQAKVKELKAQGKAPTRESEAEPPVRCSDWF